MKLRRNSKRSGITYMNPKLEKMLNKQINFELFSSYLYMSMSAYLKSLNLSGFAHWMQIQAQEELAHALKFYTYVTDRDGAVIFDKIDKPPHSWESPMEVFKFAYEHEQLVTSSISAMAEMAIQENDFTTKSHLQWFLTEQVEEEANELKIYQELKFANNSPEVLMMMDRDLASRVFVDPNAAVPVAQP